MAARLYLAFLFPVLSVAADLNRISIHYQYADGDFPAVIRSIGEYSKTHAVWPREDSLFIAKHLGVVYAADPATRERGKYHLMRLLELDMNADLADMYVSDDIQELFQRLRLENGSRLREAAARSAAERKAHRAFWQKPWVWDAGIGAAAAAGVTAAILLRPDRKPRPEYVVP